MNSMRFVALICFVPCLSLGKALNLSQSSVASYLTMQSGLKKIGSTPFEFESQASQWSGEFGPGLGGEFGLSLTSRYISWRFGLEILKPNKVSGGQAKSATSDLYEYNSDLLGYAPKATLEISPWVTPNRRIFLTGFIGSYSFTLKNEYKSLSISPSVDHTVELVGSGTLVGGGLGIEHNFVDTTSVLLECSYRSLVAKNFKYKGSGTSFLGAYTSGDPVNTSAGEPREINLSSFTLSLGLRFWLN